MREENFMQQFGWLNDAKPIRKMVWGKPWLYKNFLLIIIEFENVVIFINQNIENEI